MTKRVRWEYLTSLVARPNKVLPPTVAALVVIIREQALYATAVETLPKAAIENTDSSIVVNFMESCKRSTDIQPSLFFGSRRRV